MVFSLLEKTFPFLHSKTVRKGKKWEDLQISDLMKDLSLKALPSLMKGNVLLVSLDFFLRGAEKLRFVKRLSYNFFSRRLFQLQRFCNFIFLDSSVRISLRKMTSFMVTRLVYSLKIKIENFLNNNPKLLKVLVNFFDFTSKITRFLLFDVRVFSVIMCIGFTIFFLGTDPLLILADYLRQVSLSRTSICYAFLYIIPLDMKIFIIFLFSLFHIVTINTFLVLFDPIKRTMIAKYGPTILKDRGYNMAGSSVMKAGYTVGACFAGYCLDLAYKSYEVYVYDKTVDRVQQMSDQGQSVQLPPAPWAHRQSTVSGHVNASASWSNEQKK